MTYRPLSLDSHVPRKPGVCGDRDGMTCGKLCESGSLVSCMGISRLVCSILRTPCVRSGVYRLDSLDVISRKTAGLMLRGLLIRALAGRTEHGWKSTWLQTRRAASTFTGLRDPRQDRDQKLNNLFLGEIKYKASSCMPCTSPTVGIFCYCDRLGKCVYVWIRIPAKSAGCTILNKPKERQLLSDSKSSVKAAGHMHYVTRRGARWWTVQVGLI